MSQDLPQNPDVPAADPVPAGHADFAASTTTVTDVRPGAQTQGVDVPAADSGATAAAVNPEPSTERGWWMPSYQPAAAQPPGTAEQTATGYGDPTPDQLAGRHSETGQQYGTPWGERPSPYAVVAGSTFHTYPPPPADGTGRTRRPRPETAAAVPRNPDRRRHGGRGPGRRCRRWVLGVGAIVHGDRREPGFVGAIELADGVGEPGPRARRLGRTGSRDDPAVGGLGAVDLVTGRRRGLRRHPVPPTG